jgi:signal transduction histidine kinase
MSAEAATMGAGIDPVNILLVDDQPSRLLSYEAILGDLGHNLVRAQSGLEALERLMGAQFALILLDVSMPGMDGFETASLIHEHPRFEQTPIIFITGVHVTELDRLKGYKLGAVDYVYIPVVPEILRSKVEVLVELYAKRRELQVLNAHMQRAHAQLAEAHALLQAERTRELHALNADLRRANAELAAANAALHSEVAERARIERALKEADRHKDEFLAMLAHELRNPLAPLQNAVQIMQRRPSIDPQLVWMREIIERQLAHLSRLVDDLLDVSRITRGKISLTREPLQLEVLIARALETVQPLLTERRHELGVEIEEAGLIVEGDLTRLTQIIGNILSNAAKYTDTGGHIELRARRDGKMLEITVRDDGIGIPAELLPSVFELFTQLERPSAQAQAGLGIGLGLVRKLVELHEGTVSAQSDGPGRGSLFTVRLPLTDHCVPARPEGGVEAAGAATAPVDARRILIVDDNRDALESLVTLMQIAGHTTRGAADGETALAIAAEWRPQVVLLDLGLPRVDGYEVGRRIRAEPWGQEILLVALTGWGQEQDRRRSREAGFDSHLVKPLDLARLSELLQRLPPPRPLSLEGPRLTHS